MKPLLPLALVTAAALVLAGEGHAADGDPKPAPDVRAANKALGLFTKNDFRYDAERDLYTCPAGEELTFRHASHEKGRDIRYYRTYACGQCPLRSRCVALGSAGWDKGRSTVRAEAARSMTLSSR